MKKKLHKYQQNHNNRNFLKKQPDKLINIYGINASISAIKNNKRAIKEIFCTEKILQAHKKLIEKHNYKILEANKISSMCENENHQGILIKTTKITSNSIDHLKDSQESNQIVVILDQVTDNQNLGAIIRSASAFGIKDIIIPENNSANENSISTKIASGSMELVNLIEVVNINNIITQLKKLGFWIVGLDGSANQNLSNQKLEGKICIVLGSEGSGIRSLVRKNCDIMVKIPIQKDVESLNVSNAAAIAFYHIQEIVNLKQ